MKIVASIFLLAGLSLVSAQEHTSQNSVDLNSQSISLRGSEVKGVSANIEGSPYLYSKYVKGAVAGFTKSYQMKYNAYNDDIEFLKDGEAVVLAKQDLYSTINFTETNDILKLVDYTYKNRPIKGYLFEILRKNNLVVYRRFGVEYRPEIKAKTSYDVNISANYRNDADVFFIQKEGGALVEIPTSRRKLTELFPEKKEEIAQYFKLVKVDFSNSNDIQKLALIL